MEKEKFISNVVKLNRGTIDWKNLLEIAEYMDYILPTIPEAVRVGFSKPINYQAYNTKFEKSIIYLKKKVNIKAEELTLKIELAEIRKEQRELNKELKALYNADSVQELRKLSKLEVLTEEEKEKFESLTDAIIENKEDTKEVKTELVNMANLTEVKRVTRMKRPSIMDRLGQ